MYPICALSLLHFHLFCSNSSKCSTINAHILRPQLPLCKCCSHCWYSKICQITLDRSRPVHLDKLGPFPIVIYKIENRPPKNSTSKAKSPVSSCPLLSSLKLSSDDICVRLSSRSKQNTVISTWDFTGATSLISMEKTPSRVCRKWPESHLRSPTLWERRAPTEFEDLLKVGISFLNDQEKQPGRSEDWDQTSQKTIFFSEMTWKARCCGLSWHHAQNKQMQAKATRSTTSKSLACFLASGFLMEGVAT